MILDRWVPAEVKAVYRIDSAPHILSGLYVGICLHLLVLLGVRGVIGPQRAVAIYHEIGPFPPIFTTDRVIMAGALIFNEIALRRPGLRDWAMPDRAENLAA